MAERRDDHLLGETRMPDLVIEVNGVPLPAIEAADVVEVQVVMDKDNLTSFGFTLKNWVSLGHRATGTQSDGGAQLKYSDTDRFDIGHRIEVQLGFQGGELRSMVRGIITSLAPSFGEGALLRVAGLDALFCLRDRKPLPGERRLFEQMSDADIAVEIARRNGLQWKVDGGGEVHRFVAQKNQDDASFLIERARRMDHEAYIHFDPRTGRDTLHFVRPRDGREAGQTRTFALQWGSNLKAFSPVLNVARQVNECTVRGWSPETKQAISFTAGPGDVPELGGRGRSGPEALARCLSGGVKKNDTWVDAPITSAEEARTLAISLLRERAYDFITARGTTVGMPELRPGDNLDIQGIGRRFSGEYYVMRTVHRFGQAGFMTDFEVRRPADGGVVPFRGEGR